MHSTKDLLFLLIIMMKIIILVKIKIINDNWLLKKKTLYVLKTCSKPQGNFPAAAANPCSYRELVDVAKMFDDP